MELLETSLVLCKQWVRDSSPLTSTKTTPLLSMCFPIAGSFSFPNRLPPTELVIELHSSYNLTDELTMAKTQTKESIVVSALRARTNFGKLLQRVENERRSLVIEKRGTPRAILLSIRDYVRLAAPEPEVLTIIGEESKTKGTDAFNSQRIDNIIRAARHRKTKRK